MADKFPVYFALGQMSANPEEGSAAFVRLGDQWDDFGYKIHFTCRIFFRASSGSDTVFDTDIRLGFWEHDTDPRARLIEMLGKDRNAFLPMPDDFFVMLPELKDYRNIVTAFGVSTATRILNGLHDVVCAQHRGGKKNSWIRKALQTPVFLQAFLRSSETFFALHSAGTVLDGLEFEDFGEISSDLRIKFRLGTFSNDHELDLSFANGGDLPRNLAVLIGKNGAGKSQTLYKIAESLIRGNEVVTAIASSRPRINRLVAIAPASMAKRTFPAPGKRPRIRYKRITIGTPLNKRPESSLSATIQRLVYSTETIRRKSRWHLFMESLAAISPMLELGISTRIQPSEPVEVIHLSSLGSLAGRDAILRVLNIPANAEIVRFVGSVSYPLSMGENTFVRFAAELCLEIENGTLLLLDEPETHLHPNLITQFVDLLRRLLVATGSYAIAATHSPFFVREVPRMQVHVLKRTDDVFSTDPIRLRTLGADIGAITEFVFGDDLRDLLIDRLAARIKAKSGAAAQEIEKLAEELPNEILMQLRRQLEIN